MNYLAAGLWLVLLCVALVSLSGPALVRKRRKNK